MLVYKEQCVAQNPTGQEEWPGYKGAAAGAASVHQARPGRRRGTPGGGCGSGPRPVGKSSLGSREAEVSAFTKRSCFPVKFLGCFPQTGPSSLV